MKEKEFTTWIMDFIDEGAEMRVPILGDEIRFERTDDNAFYVTCDKDKFFVTVNKVEV